MRLALLTLCLTVGLPSAACAQSQPEWSGKQIGATAKPIEVRRQESGKADHRTERNHRGHHRGWVVIGPPVTVGVGTLDPVYGHQGGYHQDGNPAEREIQSCVTFSKGAASASSALASAPRAQGAGGC